MQQEVNPAQAEAEASSELAQKVGEFARRIVNGERTADIFGVDDGFIQSVIHQAYRFYVAQAFDKAEVLLRGAIVLDETQAYPHLLLGDIMLQGGQYPEAREEFERANNLNPEDGEVLAKLGEASLRVGQGEEAQRLLASAMELLPEDSRHHKRARVLLEVMRAHEVEPDAVAQA